MRINLINTYLYKVLNSDTMKARLNITIDESLLQEVKKFAANRDISVSELVEAYFKTITMPKKESFVDLIRSLPKPTIDENFDWKEEYYKGKMKKHGL